MRFGYFEEPVTVDRCRKILAKGWCPMLFRFIVYVPLQSGIQRCDDVEVILRSWWR